MHETCRKHASDRFIRERERAEYEDILHINIVCCVFDLLAVAVSFYIVKNACKYNIFDTNQLILHWTTRSDYSKHSSSFILNTFSGMFSATVRANYIFKLKKDACSKYSFGTLDTILIPSKSVYQNWSCSPSAADLPATCFILHVMLSMRKLSGSTCSCNCLIWFSVGAFFAKMN